MRVFTKEISGKLYFIGSYKDGKSWKQKNIPVKVANKPEDSAKALKWLEDYLSGSYIAEENNYTINSIYPTVESLIVKQYDAVIAKQVKTTFHNHLKSYSIANKPLNKLTIPEGRTYVRELTTKNDLAPYTYRNILQAAKIIVRTCRAEGYSNGINVFAEEEVLELLPKMGKLSGEVIALPREDARKLFNYTIADNKTFYIAVALASGVRAGELLALTYEDILSEYNVKYFNIVKQYGRVAKKIKLPKRDKKRRIPVHSALEQYLPGRTGRIMTYRQANEMADKLREVLRKAEISTFHSCGFPYTFHSLRRTFMDLMVEADVHEITRRMLMGHSGNSVGERDYTPTILNDLNSAIQKIKLGS